jgi:hypothetical protein
MKIIGRLGISVIFKRHFQTFYNYGLYEWTGKKKVPIPDVLTFLVLPFVISILLVWFDNAIMKSISSLIVTCLSIFIGLLFNLLILIFDLSKRETDKIKNIEQQKDDTEDKQLTLKAERTALELIKELFVNIAYAIALSILCVIIILLGKFRPTLMLVILKKTNWFGVIRHYTLLSLDTLTIFFLIQFLLTLLMILNRFFIIFNKQVEKSGT